MFKYNRLSLLLGIFTLFSLNQILAQGNKVYFYEEDLENGLHVIYNVDKSAPIVATVVHYNVGSKDEDPERTGFAHFFEHLMFEATDQIPRKKLDNYVSSAGGNLNASTSFEQTVYHIKLPASEIKMALWIEASRMRSLKVESVGVETQRGVVKEERKSRYENAPYGDALDKSVNSLFKGGTYSWTPIGTPEHLNKATIKEFQDFYNNFYQPNNATLAIVGDINLDLTRAYVREFFGTIPKGPATKRVELKIAEFKGEIRQEFKDPKAQSPALFITYRAPKMTEKEYYAFELLSKILLDGESSRLHKSLIDEEGLLSSIHGGYYPFQYSGMLHMSMYPQPGKLLADIEKEFDKQLDKIAKEGVTEKELKKVKNIVETDIIFHKKNVLNKAMELASNYTYFKKTNLINTDVDNYIDVTINDIKAVALKYLKEKNRVVLTYLPVAN